MTMTSLDRARQLAILVPNALLWGAIGSQYLGHLVPCEMCMWQRWPHLAAIGLALVAILLSKQPPASKVFVALAALAIIVSGGIGAFHAGVEYGWWKGPAECTAPALSGSGADFMKEILAAPIVRCDKPQWMLAGISLAGYNAMISILSGGIILWLLRKPR